MLVVREHCVNRVFFALAVSQNPAGAGTDRCKRPAR
jgi:hypothetical protein